MQIQERIKVDETFLEAKEVIKQMNKKKWKEKNEWEKELDKMRVKEFKQRKKQQKHEILVDRSDFEYKYK
jgi:hypothetical protein